VDDAARPGQAKCMVMPECINTVKAIIYDNVTLNRKSCQWMNLNYGSIQHIIHDELGFHTVYTRWVSQNFIPDIKQKQLHV
jgi:hypothetical protein